MRVPLLLLVLLLAGCTGAAQAPAPLARPSLDASDCSYVGVFLRVPPQLVEPSVPAEFTVSRDVGGVAIVSLGGMQCADGASGSYAWLGVNIEPPADARLRGEPAPGITIHQYSLQRFAGDDGLGRALRAAGLGVARGDVAANVGVGATMRLRSAQAQYDITDPATPVDGGQGNVVYRWRSIEPTTSGYAVLDAHLQPDLARAGTTSGLATFSSGSAGAAIFGASYGGLVSYGTGYALQNVTVESYAR